MIRVISCLKKLQTTGRNKSAQTRAFREPCTGTPSCTSAVNRERRQFTVDPGAGMHMMNKNDLTLRKGQDSKTKTICYGWVTAKKQMRKLWCTSPTWTFLSMFSSGQTYLQCSRRDELREKNVFFQLNGHMDYLLVVREMGRPCDGGQEVPCRRL